MAELTAAGESWATFKVRRMDVSCRVVQMDIWECRVWNWFSFHFLLCTRGIIDAVASRRIGGWLPT